MNRNETHGVRGRRDLAELRTRLAQARGPEFWRSLDELADTAEFRELLEGEFPAQADECRDEVGRRRFMKLMAASFALAGLSGCTRQPEERIAPFARFPEQTIPGNPLYFASAASLGGYAEGVLVESHMGRPTKVDGNPRHPASLGASTALTQASVLTLYDPDRSQVVKRRGLISSWLSFVGELNKELETQKLNDGSGIRVLTETVTSPTLASQMAELRKVFPAARWHQWEPAGRDPAREGSRLAYGEYVHTVYRFDRAEVVVSLDSDFLCQGPGNVRHARDFMSRRKVRAGESSMNRLYAFESTPSNTGAMADHRWRLKAREVEAVARALAAELGVATRPAPTPLPEPLRAALKPLAADLLGRRGASLVVAGEQQPASVHALAHAINHALGNIGKTAVLTAPVEASPVHQLESLRTLTAEMDAGQVELLVIMGGNPVFTAPADFDFAEKLSQVKLRVHLGLEDNETSRLCHWNIPEAHYLESWSDGRAYDGTVTIIQPLIQPLYAGKNGHQLISALLGRPDTSSYDLVRDYWASRHGPEGFERFWRRALHDGFIEGSAAAPRAAALRSDFDQAAPGQQAPAEGLELIFRPDPAIWDGRFANNGWLQELPKPLTRLTWDNAALLSPATAQQLGVNSEDVVELRFRGRSLEAPVWIMPGHNDGSVTVHLGHGRRQVGRVGEGTGFDAYALRTADDLNFGPGLEVHKTGKRHRLACVQEHSSMENRELVRIGSLEEYRQNPAFARGTEHERNPLSLYPDEHPYEGYAWGMSVDLNACTGCNACMVACQAENNVPIVGKQEVLKGREMHWIRIDRYYKGPLDDPQTYHQPVMCMHCENAPCEVVCPVGATVHSSEGLNDMVYNRCVGTRYCSNNCPYKVRRFNFFEYADYKTPSLKLLNNPDVTVRTRGIMEKCTFCVQRINASRIDAEKEGRQIRDGEVVTACQAACPTQAIVFGNINDPESEVSRLKSEPRDYGILADLNTRPRTTYLARLRNPNPEMDSETTNG